MKMYYIAACPVTNIWQWDLLAKLSGLGFLFTQLVAAVGKPPFLFYLSEQDYDPNKIYNKFYSKRTNNLNSNYSIYNIW